MTYDHWKTTNPDDEFGENAEQPSNFVERCCSTQRPAFTPENIREAIDAAFNERELHIDWELRNSIVDKIMALDAKGRDARSRLARECVENLNATDDGDPAGNLIHVLKRGFAAMGWAQPSLAAAQLIDAIVPVSSTDRHLTPEEDSLMMKALRDSAELVEELPSTNCPKCGRAKCGCTFSSTDRAPLGGTESCTCHFFGAGTHHVPGCPYYMIDEYRYRPRTSERLVEILRSFEYGPRSWQSEAADEIERLRKALQEIADGKNPADD